MGITPFWDNPEQTIVRYQFDVRWTWDHLHDAHETARPWYDAAPQPVGLILDAPSNVLLPGNFLSQASRALGRKHPRVHTLVVVGGNPFVVNLMQLSSHLDLHDETVLFADTLDAARQIIRAREAQV